jgi:UPF0755 protein
MLLGVGGMFYVAKTEFDRPGPLRHDTVVVIPRGEGLSAIAERLEREGVISNRIFFEASVRLYFRAENKLKAGEYAITKNASIRGVLDTLISGRAKLSIISIPEGFTSQQVVNRLMASPELTGEITEVPEEGALLPDTYRFARGVSRDDMIRRMQNEQRKFVNKVWEERSDDSPIKTKKELIILASIVEKETGRADERRRVAAVFLNRLKHKMRLQSDPTFMYGITLGKRPLGHPPTRAERDTPTPYNTYTIPALPPGPIANPGRAAIEAVIHPAKTTNLYFVANGAGGHAFADTNAEHNANVQKWRIIERRLRAEREAREKEAQEQAQRAQEAAASAASDEGNALGGPHVITEIPTVAPGVADKTAVRAGASRRLPPLPERKPKRL